LGVTDHPHERFVVQTAKNETTEGGFFQRLGARYLIHDRDTKFTAAWKHVLNEASVEPLAIPANSPSLNGFAERWVRTVKRECLRRVQIVGAEDLRQVLNEFVGHYHRERPHQGLGNRPPEQGPGPPAQNLGTVDPSRIRCRLSCGGAVRHYYRAAA
jgi:transposase InsO family protein